MPLHRRRRPFIVLLATGKKNNSAFELSKTPRGYKRNVSPS
jgi:hypothetical protein